MGRWECASTPALVDRASHVRHLICARKWARNGTRGGAARGERRVGHGVEGRKRARARDCARPATCDKTHRALTRGNAPRLPAPPTDAITAAAGERRKHAGVWGGGGPARRGRGGGREGRKNWAPAGGEMEGGGGVKPRDALPSIV